VVSQSQCPTVAHGPEPAVCTATDPHGRRVTGQRMIRMGVSVGMTVGCSRRRDASEGTMCGAAVVMVIGVGVAMVAALRGAAVAPVCTVMYGSTMVGAIGRFGAHRVRPKMRTWCVAVDVHDIAPAGAFRRAERRRSSGSGASAPRRGRAATCSGTAGAVAVDARGRA
jgi:hypothetical protein